jgi:competence protein ComEC
MNPTVRLWTVVFFAMLLLGNGLVWHRILSARGNPGFYFLDVGQGDSTLIVFPSGAKVLTDAGPDAAVARQLENALPPGDRYIDVGIISHPQLDHFGGFRELIRRYTFGAIIINGRDADATDPTSEWFALRKQIAERRVPHIVAGAGDRITIAGDRIAILHPDKYFLGSAELNDTGIVELVEFGGLRALLAADIGFAAEDYLLRKFRLDADILKVGHHGSKYSTGEPFLKAVTPRAAVVSLGARNRFGHPTKETLDRLDRAGAKVFRTDTEGTVFLSVSGRTLRAESMR